MGRFYTNVTLRTSDRDRIVETLTGQSKTAYVSRAESGAVVVFERESESQEPELLYELATTLSAQLQCAALAVINHDDSVLLYALFDSGELIDEYNSSPGYFGEAIDVETDGDTDDASRGGEAATLAGTFGALDRAISVAGILHSDECGVVETDRHARLVDVLALPACAAGAGYTTLDHGEYPSGYDAASFERVGAR